MGFKDLEKKAQDYKKMNEPKSREQGEREFNTSEEQKIEQE